MKQPRSSLRNILKNTGWLLGGKGVSAVLSLIYLAIVTRTLGIEGFGKFSLVLGAAQAVELLVSFQSWQIVVRYGIPHLNEGKGEDLDDLLRFCTFLDIAAAVASTFVVTAVMLVMEWHFGWTRAFTWDAVACGVLFVLSTHWTPIGILRMRDRFDTAALADATTPVVRCAGAVLVLLTGPSVIGFFAVWAAAEFLTAVAYWVSALRMQRVALKGARPFSWRQIAATNPGIVRYAVATNVNSSLDVGSKQIALLLIGFLLSPAAVGGFRLAQQLAQSLAKFSQMMGRAIFPELMRSRVEPDGSDQFKDLLGRTFRLTACGAAIVLLVVFLLGKPLIGLIGGKEFLAAYPLLLLLGIAAAIDFASVAFEPALVAMGRAGLALKLRIISTTVLLLGIVGLTPYRGTLGASLAVVAASVSSATMLWFVLRPVIGRAQAKAATTASERSRTS